MESQCILIKRCINMASSQPIIQIDTLKIGRKKLSLSSISIHLESAFITQRAVVRQGGSISAVSPFAPINTTSQLSSRYGTIHQSFILYVLYVVHICFHCY